MPSHAVNLERRNSRHGPIRPRSRQSCLGRRVHLHDVRMRFWGEIVSPSLQASPIKTIESLWPNGLPNFEDRKEANAFFQALMGLWNNVARFQDGSLKLQKVDKVDTREALHAAGKLRVEELLDGFMHGFTGGDRQIDR